MNFVEQDNKQLAELLWREYEPYIRKLCNYKLNSHKEYIDDCVQAVFTALVEALHRGITIDYPKNWLTAVANNKIKDIYSTAAKMSDKIISLTEQKAVDNDYIINDIALGIENISDEQILKIKEKIIQLLDENERQLLYERFEIKLSVASIAEKYEITENNVYQKLFRLRCKTKRLIKEYLQ